LEFRRVLFRSPDFLFDTLTARLDMDAMEGKAKLGRLALPLLDKLPAGIFRQLMQERLSQLTGMSVAKLQALSPAAAETQSAAPAAPEAPQAPTGPDAGRFGGDTPGTSWCSRQAPSRIRVELSPCMRAVNLLLRKPGIIQAVQLPAELAEMEAQD